MKINKYFKSTLILGLVGILTVSCSKEDKLTVSYLDTSTPELSDLDQDIRQEFTTPYNIEVLYNWNENEVDLDRYLYPPKISSVRPALDVIKHVWIDTYNEVGGDDFIKKVAPRQLLMVGGVNLNQSATVILGLAEGGKKITFFETDFLDLDNEANVIRFMSTIQHEYTHILNQTKPFDEQAYGEITPGGYTAQWYDVPLEEAYDKGYITQYSQQSVIEDFAEMVRTMLSTSSAEYNALISNIPNEEARQHIRDKEAIVADYFQDSYGVSIYDLQDTAYEHIQDILNQ